MKEIAIDIQTAKILGLDIYLRINPDVRTCLYVPIAAVRRVKPD